MVGTAPHTAGSTVELTGSASPLVLEIKKEDRRVRKTPAVLDSGSHINDVAKLRGGAMKRETNHPCSQLCGCKFRFIRRDNFNHMILIKASPNGGKIR